VSLACAVVAPGLVPVRPDERVKTDPRDARKLAQLHAAGLLEPIHVPSPELEAARDLIRAREDARIERMRARHRLGKLLLRNDRRLPTKTWGVTRRRWLSQQRFPERRARRPSTTTCTRSTWSTPASRPSSGRSLRSPPTRPSPRSSAGCATCAASTP
jgi:hypothetical protein